MGSGWGVFFSSIFFPGNVRKAVNSKGNSFNVITSAKQFLLNGRSGGDFSRDGSLIGEYREGLFFPNHSKDQELMFLESIMFAASVNILYSLIVKNEQRDHLSLSHGPLFPSLIFLFPFSSVFSSVCLC